MPVTQPRAIQLVRFLAAGLPAFLLAVPANFLLVEFAHVPKGPAYALVLTIQIVMNFFMCRWFVFEKKSATSRVHDFTVFFTGILFIRVIDWCVYFALVTGLGLYYLAVQIFNVLLFSVVKFLFSERALT